jgi:hypothetical protein
VKGWSQVAQGLRDGRQKERKEALPEQEMAMRSEQKTVALPLA